MGMCAGKRRGPGVVFMGVGRQVRDGKRWPSLVGLGLFGQGLMGGNGFG
jgi:hypothetical protein